MVDLNPNQLHFDGESQGDPGLAGAGAVVKQGKDVYELGKFLASATKSEAEYTALILGLKKALELGISDLAIYNDSEDVINYLSGDKEAIEPELVALGEEAQELVKQIDEFKLNHVKPRKNRHADWVANQAMEMEQDFERQENLYNKYKQQQKNQQQQQKQPSKKKSKK